MLYLLLLKPENVMSNSMKIIEDYFFEKFYKSVHVRFRKLFFWYINDYFIISFPKSGRTWLRYILSLYIAEYFKRSVSLNIAFPRRDDGKLIRVAFTHLDSDSGKLNLKKIKKLKNKKVVLLTRDPRDVSVSYFFHKTKRERQEVGDMYPFVKDGPHGIKAICNFINTIYKMRFSFSDFLLLKYERMCDDTSSEVAKLLRFIGINNVDEQLLKKVIELSSFDNMKKIEAAGSFNDARIIPTDKNDPDSYKVRRGKVNGYIDYFNNNELKVINALVSECKGDMDFGKS